ncbi:MAG: ornithine carbamoyltransferase [Desulfobulbaceae bacterium]|nr:ornithine carbamoyltransferase [Desulfobulbaceae bacterium]
MHKHFLALSDYSKDELLSWIHRAMVLKAEAAAGTPQQQLAGKTACLLFEKPSTRTRVSFEAAMYGLGGQVVFMSARDSQLGRGEPLKDTARVLGRYVHTLVVRTFGQNVVEELAHYAGIPVINALTDLYHPCQVLSDLMTVLEKKKRLDGLQVAWIGDGNNMANTWIEAAAIFGFQLRLACPQGFIPDENILKHALTHAPACIGLSQDPEAAIAGADVVNVDVWASMGQEAEQEARLAHFAGYQLDSPLLAKAKEDAIVLHCLPAHRGEEISEEVLEGPQSVVFDQAENKMHVHKALLEHFILQAA